MKSFRLHFVLGLFSLLLASSAFAVYVPKISGYLNYGYTYDTDVAGGTMKVCTSPTAEPEWCRAATTDRNGYYAIYNWNVGDGDYLYFFPFIDHGTPLYGRTGVWGSPYQWTYRSKACQSKDQWGFCKNFGVTYSAFVYPRPLEPVAVNPYPDQTDVELTQTMKWTNSSDYWRQNAGIVYDIYGSGYGSPLLLQVADLPCNPDSNNRCQWELPINLDPQTPYNWKIVARTNYGYETESQVYHFSTGW